MAGLSTSVDPPPPEDPPPDPLSTLDPPVSPPVSMLFKLTLKSILPLNVFADDISNSKPIVSSSSTVEKSCKSKVYSVLIASLTIESGLMKFKNA